MLIAGVREGLAQDPTLNPAQVTALSNLFVSLQGLNAGRELPLAASPAALAAQAVRSVHHCGYSYIVSMPAEDEDAGEVLFFCNDDNADGVDWGDFVLELIVGVCAVALALGAATGAIARVTRALRQSDLYDRLKALLRSPTFREKLRKFAELIPGGTRVTEIYDALKELLSDLWEVVIKPGFGDIRTALSRIISPWTIFWSILSWLLRFLSGGAVIIAELGLLLGALTVKVLRPREA